ncbi:MAG: tetratricopeptide repeat protein [Spirochaetota bacterium]|nr:tetratricopeptide repeat protein [Spirochaetota bacterium]
MEQNGQLNFSDDPLLAGSNESFQFLEEGKFLEAVTKLDELMSINPNYPGLGEGYRTARFWNNREKEINNLDQGKQTADFLMIQWMEFENYAEENHMKYSMAYHSAMKYIFFTASEHYKIAFRSQDSSTDNFDLLLNLGICFLILEEYNSAIETLEYARSIHKNSARLLSMLGEAYYHTGEMSKGLLYLKEAFLINPSEIDISALKSKPILELIKIVHSSKPDCNDPREWMPIFGFVKELFNARRQLNRDQVEVLKRDIRSLEKSFQTLSKERIYNSNIIPRLANKYLWMLEYFRYQEYDSTNIKEIKERLIQIDGEIFEIYFMDTQ